MQDDAGLLARVEVLYLVFLTWRAEKRRVSV